MICKILFIGLYLILIAAWWVSAITIISLWIRLVRLRRLKKRLKKLKGKDDGS